MREIREEEYTLKAELITSFIRVMEVWDSSFFHSRGPINGFKQTVARLDFFNKFVSSGTSIKTCFMFLQLEGLASSQGMVEGVAAGATEGAAGIIGRVARGDSSETKPNYSSSSSNP